MIFLDRLLNENKVFALPSNVDPVFLRLAYLYAEENSTDLSTWTGAVIVKDSEVITKGANVYPENCRRGDGRYEKKYCTQDHAERNAIFSAAKHGQALEGSSIWSP